MQRKLVNSAVRWSLLGLALAALVACAATSGKWVELSQRAANYQFRPVNFQVPPFELAGLIKGEPSLSSDLVVYLEGDGRGVVRGRVTEDPTPTRAMGFELAKSDPAPAILYLARVGQFQPGQTGGKYQEYWSNKRLAEETVQAANQAITQAKAMFGASRIHLVGYSGGGGLAVLLSERRSDVATVVTVVGLLDTNWWVREKNFQPLTGSLNPADQAELTVAIPQIHFVGSEDAIIPPDMSAHYQRLAPFVSFKRVEMKTNHWQGWPEMWPDLLNKYVIPLRESNQKAPGAKSN